LTGAMVIDTEVEHNAQHLSSHPVVERLVDLGGSRVQRLLLSPESMVHRWLRGRFYNDQLVDIAPRPSDTHSQPRIALYVSGSLTEARRVRDADRMSHDQSDSDDPMKMGALLGYPQCCVKAFARLKRRWPNRMPISAAAAQTTRYVPRLNNLSLNHFAWISWFPCRYDCDASAAIAEHVAAFLLDKDPEVVTCADNALSLPRIYLDDHTQYVCPNATQRDDDTFTLSQWIPINPPPHDDTCEKGRVEMPRKSRRVGNQWRIEGNVSTGAPSREPLFFPFETMDP